MKSQKIVIIASEEQIKNEFLFGTNDAISWV